PLRPRAREPRIDERPPAGLDRRHRRGTRVQGRADGRADGQRADDRAGPEGRARRRRAQPPAPERRRAGRRQRDRARAPVGQVAARQPGEEGVMADEETKAPKPRAPRAPRAKKVQAEPEVKAEVAAVAVEDEPRETPK